MVRVDRTICVNTMGKVMPVDPPTRSGEDREEHWRINVNADWYHYVMSVPLQI
jgi:hypothetical protein